MRIVKGTYEMALGYNSQDKKTPPIAALIMLTEHSSYEMVNPNAWHYVNPVGSEAYSLMIAGSPWPGCNTKSNLKLSKLSQHAKNEILEIFRNIYPLKASCNETDLPSQVRKPR